MDSVPSAWGTVLSAASAVPAPLAAWSIAVVFLGYLVLGVSGFGSALTIVPLLALQWPLVTVVPLVLLLDVQSSLFLTRLNAGRIEWPELRPLLPGMAVGAAAGAMLAPWTAQPWVLALLGLYVLAVGLRGLLQVATPVRFAAANRAWAPLFGVAAGAVESVFGTSGPVVVAWLARRLHEPHALRATVPAGLAAVTCCALAGMAITGQLFQLMVWAGLLPLTAVAFAGTRAGHALAGRMPAPVVARIILGLLACAGTAMLLRALL